MRVVVSERAKRNRNQIAQHIMRKFGRIAFVEFCDEYHKVKRTIAAYPESCPVDENLSNSTYTYHYTFINGLSKLLYRIVDDSFVFIVDMWDVRREPPAEIKL